MEILMQQLLHNSKKYAVSQSFFVLKNYFIKNRLLATILQNDRPWRSLFWLQRKSMRILAGLNVSHSK